MVYVGAAAGAATAAGVYAQKPRQALAVFETPHDSVIEEVIADAKHKRNGGFTRAMVVVK